MEADVITQFFIDLKKIDMVLIVALVSIIESYKRSRKAKKLPTYVDWKTTAFTGFLVGIPKYMGYARVSEDPRIAALAGDWVRYIMTGIDLSMKYAGLASLFYMALFKPFLNLVEKYTSKKLPQLPTSEQK